LHNYFRWFLSDLLPIRVLRRPCWARWTRTLFPTNPEFAWPRCSRSSRSQKRSSPCSRESVSALWKQNKQNIGKFIIFHDLKIFKLLMSWHTSYFDDILSVVLTYIIKVNVIIAPWLLEIKKSPTGFIHFHFNY
jgi:hypothetical protein